MRTAIRLTALAVAMGTSVFWFFGGPNTGWTKNYVEIPKVDPITEQKYSEKIERFVPGIDFLCAGIGLAVIIFGLSFLFRRKQSTAQA